MGVNILGVEILRLTRYKVLKAESANEMGVLFQVLKGELPLQAAMKFLPKSKVTPLTTTRSHVESGVNGGLDQDILVSYTAVKFVHYYGVTYLHFTLFTHCHIQRCYQQLPVAWIQPPSPLFLPLQMLWSPCTEFQRANIQMS